MKYILCVVMIAAIGVISFGRTKSELEEWREKGLPSQIKRGVVVEIYDMKEAPGDATDINIRVHNLSEGRVGALKVKVWFWKDEGVHIEELELVEENKSEDLSRGREKFFPRKGSYYRLKEVKYSEVRRIDLEISRILSKRS